MAFDTSLDLLGLQYMQMIGTRSISSRANETEGGKYGALCCSLPEMPKVLSQMLVFCVKVFGTETSAR